MDLSSANGRMTPLGNTQSRKLITFCALISTEVLDSRSFRSTDVSIVFEGKVYPPEFNVKPRHPPLAEPSELRNLAYVCSLFRADYVIVIRIRCFRAKVFSFFGFYLNLLRLKE